MTRPPHDFHVTHCKVYIMHNGYCSAVAVQAHWCDLAIMILSTYSVTWLPWKLSIVTYGQHTACAQLSTDTAIVSPSHYIFVEIYMDSHNKLHSI